MHLHFIFPRWIKLLESHPHLRETLSGYDIGNFRMVGLGLTTAVGALPDGIDVTFVDDHVEEIDYSIKPDAVCLSFFTAQAGRAYEIADEFKKRGVPVIAGGIHPSMAPEDTLLHVDAVITGPVEGLWPQVLKDLKSSELKRVYTGTLDAAFAKPKTELFSRSNYLRAGVIQTARGCRVNCPFCIVPRCYGTDEIHKPISTVLEDIAELPHACFFFGDENLLFTDPDNTAYTRQLLTEMIARKLRKPSFMANFPRFVKLVADEDWKLLAKAGMRQIYLIVGMMAPLKKELRDQQLIDAILRANDLGIQIFATFTLGHDQDNEPVEPLIHDFCEATNNNLVEFTINVPFPGTHLHKIMQKRGRLLTRDWSRYNAAQVVFEPLHETPEQLEQRYLDLWNWFYQDIGTDEMLGRYAKGFGGDIIRTNRPA